MNNHNGATTKKIPEIPLYDIHLHKIKFQILVRNYTTCLLVIGNATIDDSFSTGINNDKWQLDGRICSRWTTLTFHRSISFNKVFE